MSSSLFFLHFLLLHLRFFRLALSASLPSFPSSSSSPSSSSLSLSSPFSSDNSIFDASPLVPPPPFPNERSVLPGVQVFPQGQNFPGFLGRGGALGSGAVDLETWSKQQAVRMNQENAVVSQLAQMAPQRRNQLARDMAAGNSTAANELVGRLMRDLAGSQHGMMAFPHLGGGAMGDPMLQGMGPFGVADPALAATMRSSAGPFPSSSFPPSSLLALPLPLQLQLAQQRQFLLNGGGGTFRQNSLGFGQSNFGQLSSTVSPFDRFSSSSSSAFQSSQPPRNPFQSSEFADLSRPNPFSSSFAGQTQITPLSQSLFSSAIGRGTKFGGSNNDFGRTLSGTLRTMDDLDGGGAFSSNGKGIVDDVTVEDAFGRRMTANGGGTFTRRRGDEDRRKMRKMLRME